MSTPADLRDALSSLQGRRRGKYGNVVKLGIVAQCAALGLPAPVCEFKFHPSRRWRFDFAWPDHRLALEQDGAVWTQGRHVRGAGVERDCEKYAEAILLGWTVFRATTGQAEKGIAIAWIERYFAGAAVVHSEPSDVLRRPTAPNPTSRLGGGQRG